MQDIKTRHVYLYITFYTQSLFVYHISYTKAQTKGALRNALKNSIISMSL